jgi:hypothetical protein
MLSTLQSKYKFLQVCLGIEHPCGTWDQISLPVGILLFEICGLVSAGRLLWPEDRSAICSVITFTLWLTVGRSVSSTLAGLATNKEKKKGFLYWKRHLVVTRTLNSTDMNIHLAVEWRILLQSEFFQWGCRKQYFGIFISTYAKSVCSCLLSHKNVLSPTRIK